MKLKRPKQAFPLVEVWWDDATGCAQGWIDDRDLKIEPTIVLSVGFLVKETDEYIIIASDIDNQKMHNGRTQIPKGMVKKMRVIRGKDKDESIHLHERADQGTNPQSTSNSST